MEMNDKETKDNTERAEKFKNKIEGSSKVNFGISSCPLPLYERFKAVCKTDFSDTYHLALRYFLDLYDGRKEADAQWDVIHKHHEQLLELEGAVMELQEIINSTPEPAPEDGAEEEFKKSIKTFGKKPEAEESE